MSHYQRSSSNTPGPGFLGSTSFSSVYQGLQTLHPELPGNGDATHSRRENFYSYDRDSKIRNGAACLSLLQNMPAYDPLLRKWRLGAKLYMTAPWLVACDSSMRTEVYDLLGTSDEMDEQLLRISARIFANTLRPLDLQRGCTLDQYGDKFTGENLRWEAVGIFFSAVGFAAMVVEDVGAEPNSSEKRYVLAKQMLEASDTCISFCEEFQQLTDPEMWLVCDNLHMCTLVEGDASYHTWRRLGNLISACVAKGLHGEIEVSADVPFWMSELRKRLFASTYIFDKTISNFLGRPPRLPRKYCTMQLPLDLELNHLRLPDTELEDVVNRLDQHGWNTDTSLGGMVWIRCHFILSMICEDVLELALAALPEHDGSLGQ
jgi:Fungal specific transcription factor domain